MAKAVRIEISDEPTQDIIHRFRNFGEDIYHALRNECDVDIDEIDRSTTQFVVRNIKARRLGRVRKLIESELRQHNFEKTGRVIQI